MKKIIVVTNKYKDIGLYCTKNVLEVLRRQSCRVTMSDKIDDECEADFIVVIGGDGTIMRAARRAAKLDVPILGVNLGRVGYLAELEPDEISMVERLFTGEFTVEKRMMLSAEINGERVDGLNDAVVSNGIVSRMAEIELWCDGNRVNRYHADGLITSTPTGSTAYSMSAGGPVIDPKLDCFCVTPICSHSLRAKPLIFTADSELSVVNVQRDEDGRSDLYLTVDGNENFPLAVGSAVKITRSEIVTKLIRMKKYGFYNVLNKKMSE